MGAGLLGVGALLESLAAFEGAGASYPDALHGAGELALALVYVGIDSLRAQGRTLAQKHMTDASFMTQALRILANAAVIDSLYLEAAEYYESLAGLGTSEHRIKARIDALANLHKGGRDVLSGIDALLSDEPLPDLAEERLRQAAQERHRTAHLLYLKATILTGNDRESEALSIWGTLTTDYTDTHHGKEAASRPS